LANLQLFFGEYRDFIGQNTIFMQKPPVSIFWLEKVENLL